MNQRSQKAASSARTERSGGDRERAPSLDLRLIVVDEHDDKQIFSVGGRWLTAHEDADGNKIPGRYLEEHETIGPRRERVIRLHVGQLGAAHFFDEWLRDHLDGIDRPETRVFDLAFSGGRRGGKSSLMFVLGVAYALAVPGAIISVKAASDAYYSEPIRYLEAIMPTSWYRSLGAPHWTYYLANGSIIKIESGHTAKRQKQGEADLILINEGQAIPPTAYTTMSASIVDRGGLLISASNPPDVGDPGEWVTNLVLGADRGDLPNARHFFFDPLDNPHINQAALEALRFKMGPHEFDVQVRGKFLATPDSVLYSWDRRENERPMPLLGDCTAEFTKFFEGREYTDIVSVDVQNFPWIAAVRWRAFRDPLSPTDMERCSLWGVGEAFVDQGDEVDCALILKKEIGVEAGERTLVVMDASCDWQQMQRKEELQRTEFRGKGSMDMFRACGFRHVVPPDTQARDNPDIKDRCRAGNARIGTKAGSRHLFADPRACPKTVESILRWKTRPDGTPSRHSRAAHGGDCVTYVVWRFFPRRVQQLSTDVTAIKRFQGRDRLKGY